MIDIDDLIHLKGKPKTKGQRDAIEAVGEALIGLKGHFTDQDLADAMIGYAVHMNRDLHGAAALSRYLYLLALRFAAEVSGTTDARRPTAH